jgi:hypothetical protein
MSIEEFDLFRVLHGAISSEKLERNSSIATVRAYFAEKLCQVALRQAQDNRLVRLTGVCQ